MEVVIKLSAPEALQATESGALTALIKAAKEQTEVSAAAQTEAPTPHRDCASSEPAETPTQLTQTPMAEASPAPVWTPGGGAVDDSTPRTPVPAAPAPQAAAAETPRATVPTSTKSYTVDEIQLAAIGLMDKGQQAQLMALLSKFGVQALPDLAQDQYGAFALELRQMGAEI